MPLQLDHAVIAVQNLEAAMEEYRGLGFTVIRGGVHANRATENALIIFADSTYLELLAATGESPVPHLIDFSVLLRNDAKGVVGYALRSENLEEDVARLRRHDFAVGDIVPGERLRQDGTLIQWKLALLEGGFAPFLIQDVTPREYRISQDPAITKHANRVTGLQAIEITVHHLMPAIERYHRMLGRMPDSIALIESKHKPEVFNGLQFVREPGAGTIRELFLR